MSETPPNEHTCEQALSLYTFYESRVQSTKSILIGVLAGILSLQVSFLGDIFKNNYPSLVNAFPIIVLSIIAISVFYSLKRHMENNVSKSEYFQNILGKYGLDYYPETQRINICFRWQLDWIFLGIIALLALLSIVFIVF